MALEESKEIHALAQSGLLAKFSRQWMRSVGSSYTYQFEWCGLPIIQYPTDVFALQELIWEMKPRNIIETGVARGGSALFLASMLALLDLEEQSHLPNSTFKQSRKLFAIDIDIRDYARHGIENSFLAPWINLVQGNSVDKSTYENFLGKLNELGPTILILDSNHTHDHVLKELRMYSGLVTLDSYIVVLDTEIEFLPDDNFIDRPWKKGNSPHSALTQFLLENPNFMIDHDKSSKLGITTAPDGFLKRIS